MREMGLHGSRRGKTWTVTTDGDDGFDRPADLVDRQFAAPAPNRLWVADLTYVKTHAGWVYVAFIIDVFSRMVVGWQASRVAARRTSRSTRWRWRSGNRQRRGRRPLRAGPSQRPRRPILSHSLLRAARRQRHRRVGRLEGRQLRQRLAERFNGLYKWELIYRQGPWHGLDDVEFATMTYVDWFNHRRLHGEITDGPGYTTPAAHEADYYRQDSPGPRAGHPIARAVTKPGGLHLSPRVATGLCDAGFGAVHVADIGLLRAADEEIFDRAAADCPVAAWSRR